MITRPEWIGRDWSWCNRGDVLDFTWRF